MLQYFTEEHHIFGGNISSTLESYKHRNKKTREIEKQHDISTYYTQSEFYEQQPGFKLDERWKSELSEESLKRIERQLGNLNSEPGY